MTEIKVDPQSMERLFVTCEERIDDVDRELGRVPQAPDAGIASELVGLVMAASAEGAGVTADAFRALIAIARDVMVDFEHSDTAAAEELRDLLAELESDS